MDLVERARRRLRPRLRRVLNATGVVVHMTFEVNIVPANRWATYNYAVASRD